MSEYSPDSALSLRGAFDALPGVERAAFVVRLIKSWPDKPRGIQTDDTFSDIYGAAAGEGVSDLVGRCLSAPDYVLRAFAATIIRDYQGLRDQEGREAVPEAVNLLSALALRPRRPSPEEISLGAEIREREARIAAGEERDYSEEELLTPAEVVGGFGWGQGWDDYGTLSFE